MAKIVKRLIVSQIVKLVVIVFQECRGPPTDRDTRTHTSGIDVGTVGPETVLADNGDLEDISDNGDNNINGNNFLLNISGQLWLLDRHTDVAKTFKKVRLNF